MDGRTLPTSAPLVIVVPVQVSSHAAGTAVGLSILSPQALSRPRVLVAIWIDKGHDDLRYDNLTIGIKNMDAHVSIK